MGICASKPKTKEIDLSQAPETPRAKGHTRDRSIDTNITIGKDELSLNQLFCCFWKFLMKKHQFFFKINHF